MRNSTNSTRQPDGVRQRQSSKKSDSGRRQSGGKRLHGPKSSTVFKSWLINHLDIAIASLMRLFGMPLQTFMTVMVIAVAICTPMLVYSFAQSIQASVVRLNATTDISIYLDLEATDADVTAVRNELERLEGLGTVSYISAQQGLEDFEQQTGLSQILDNLSENPIPAVFVVSVTPEFVGDTELPSMLADEIEQIAHVEKVVFDYAWVERLQALINFMNRLILVLGLLLAIGIAVILGNTIRLEIENRREEIVIVKLVGGTNAFVRRPLLYTGFWYGFLGGLLAWVLANIGVAALDQPLGDLSRLYISDFGLGFLNLAILGVVLVLGCILGLAGAWLAVARHLSDIEPR